MSPIYQFLCPACGRITERFTHDFELGDVPCDDCGGETRRQLGLPIFKFVGAGFHCNDYHPDKVNTLDEFVHGKKGREYKPDIDDIPEDL